MNYYELRAPSGARFHVESPRRGLRTREPRGGERAGENAASIGRTVFDDFVIACPRHEWMLRAQNLRRGHSRAIQPRESGCRLRKISTAANDRWCVAPTGLGGCRRVFRPATNNAPICDTCAGRPDADARGAGSDICVICGQPVRVTASNSRAVNDPPTAFRRGLSEVPAFPNAPPVRSHP